MLFEDTYLSIASPAQGLFKDKGSKFISFAFPVAAEEDIKAHLKELKKEHFSARHHCYAYRLGADKLTSRTNDDGEPPNTAGKPILGQIQSKDLSNVLIVVVRYFGGTLLGVGGLIQAYRNAAADALLHAKIIEKTVHDFYELHFSYAVLNEVMKIIKDEKLLHPFNDFNLSCKVIFSVRRNNSERIVAMFRKIPTLELKYLKTQ